MSSKTKRIAELEADLARVELKNRRLRDAEYNRLEAEKAAEHEKRNAEHKAAYAARDAEREKVKHEKLQNIRNGLIPLAELRNLVRNIATTTDGPGSATVTTITLRTSSAEIGSGAVSRAIVDALGGKSAGLSLAGLFAEPSRYGGYTDIPRANGGLIANLSAF